MAPFEKLSTSNCMEHYFWNDTVQLTIIEYIMYDMYELITTKLV